jgi:hypothetical protein
MSRSGYVEDCDEDYNNSGALWAQAIKRAIRGKRGQAFLREMAAALDAMPTKELITDDIVRDGQACAIGAVAIARKVDVSKLDPHDYNEVAKTFGVAPCLVREVVFQNDDDFDYIGPRAETPAHRWTRIRKWVDEQLTQPEARHG